MIVATHTAERLRLQLTLRQDGKRVGRSDAASVTLGGGQVRLVRVDADAGARPARD